MVKYRSEMGLVLNKELKLPIAISPLAMVHPVQANTTILLFPLRIMKLWDLFETFPNSLKDSSLLANWCCSAVFPGLAELGSLCQGPELHYNSITSIHWVCIAVTDLVVHFCS